MSRYTPVEGEHMPRSTRAELGGSHYVIVFSVVLFLLLILWLTGNLAHGAVAIFR